MLDYCEHGTTRKQANADPLLQEQTLLQLDWRQNGKYMTATTCPYPMDFAKHWSEYITRPQRDRRVAGGASLLLTDGVDHPSHPEGLPGKQTMLEGGITIDPITLRCRALRITSRTCQSTPAAPRAVITRSGGNSAEIR